MIPAHTLLSVVLSVALGPKVSAVVVYPDRAQVTRSATVDCSRGATVRFENLPPSLDAATVRARTDVGEIAGLRTEEEPRAAAYAKRATELEEQDHQLELALIREQEKRQRADVLDADAVQLDDVAVRMIDRELTTPKPNTRAWSDALDRVGALRMQSATARAEADIKVRELSRRRSDLQQEKSRLAASAARRSFVAEAVVSCPAGRSARIELTYLVGGASWEPVYEARSDEDAGQVELATYATVVQSTGEDWLGAKLALSTALPVDNATPPEIAPLKVFSEKHEEEKKVLTRRDEYQEHAEASGAEAAATGQSTGMAAATQGLSVQLAVPAAADVPADGKPVRLFVSRSHLKAKFALRTIPKLLPFVFKVADLVNTGSFPLLPAQLEVYGKTGFLARTGIDRVPQGGAFHVTFGMDDRIRVKRDVLAEVVKDEGLFGSTRRYNYGYRFVVSNYEGGTQKVELAEHLPVSELDDVKVEMDPKTTAGYALNAQDGIATWKLSLAPSEQKTIELRFHVDVPASYVQ